MQFCGNLLQTNKLSVEWWFSGCKSPHSNILGSNLVANCGLFGVVFACSSQWVLGNLPSMQIRLTGRSKLPIDVGVNCCLSLC